MLWAVGHLDLSDHDKTSITKKARGEDLRLKTLQMLQTLTIKGPLLFSRYLFWKKI